LIAYSPTPKVEGQEISRKAGKLFEGAPALILNYPAAKIIPFTSFIKLRFTLECNGIYVHVTPGFDARLLEDILMLLKRG
jgi:hypothetical protein